MMKKTLATAALALLAVLAVPTAASAAYVPAADVVVADNTVVAGAATNVGIAAGSFTPAEPVTFSVTGEGSATLAILRAATVSLTKAAAADGSTSVKVTLPANASGTYTLTATGGTSGNVATAAITAVAADGSATALPRTGGEIPFAVIWIAAGAVALGVVLVAVLTLRRRNQTA
ncbi:sortase [Salinibacterium sp. ZJ450]|uniref:sortase n=1 Tax=Salinibacterium sp. ZJ450 TaxID=2708338 RepID=UPI00141FD4F6|nr:sortase [Salinibacterium sp. ZJ450]